MITALIGVMTAMNKSSNAELAMIRGAEARMNLAFKASQVGNMNNIDSFQRQDKNLMLANQTAYTQYMMNNALKDSCQKLLDKKIKDFAPKFC